MIFRNAIVAGMSVLALTAGSTLAMAQATTKENNATSGSSADMEMKSGKGMKSDSGAGSMESKSDKPTSAGSEQNQSKDLRGHSETPTTGAGK